MRFGILTSGGDAPGMNAALRSFVLRAVELGVSVGGVRRGYLGLLAGDIIPFGVGDVRGIIQRGGTVLRTARCDEMFTGEGRRRAYEMARGEGLDALCVIGGDGTLQGARCLAELGLPTVCVPGTIDNDMDCTDMTIGFDTAVNIAVSAVDRLRDTTESHERCAVVEVMGRSSGKIAETCAIASGALAALVPERDADLEKVLFAPLRSGAQHMNIVIVSEGYRLPSRKVAKLIEENTGYESRLTVLGHIQRGGAPSAFDRVLAAKMGALAAETLLRAEGSHITVYRDGKVSVLKLS
ncbi:MAG: ATP-dependent 6-phosphofructokinase [Oscillospiraceae bacterium]|jgi:6-phosphofructokinase 1